MRTGLLRRPPRAAWPVIAAGTLLAACAKAPVVEPPPPPVSVVVEVAAAPDVNPDLDGRASPVSVRVLELSDATSFGKAEFFPLWDQEAQVLGPTLVARHEVTLAPGARAEIPFALDPKVRSIGVVAAFRDFRSATWKSTVAIPGDAAPGSTMRLAVDVGSQAVALSWQ
jgi:type VI secretion system protein VasD